MTTLRSIFVRLLKNNEHLLSLYNFVLFHCNKSRFSSIQKYKDSLTIFDYYELAQEMPFCPFERIADSNYYGHAYSFKEYSGSKVFDYAIEHGLYYDNYVPLASKLKTVKRILTMSEVREDVLKQSIHKPVIKVGPYIHYAKPLLDVEEFNEIKAKYGKILLFFPSHTCPNEGKAYDVHTVILKITNFASSHNFDSVFVNMYYYDILHSNYAQHYIDAGFKIVTAGHRLDIHFISRLKSIIQLSDYTISNNVGTHLGYCIYMNKPHFIFDQILVESETEKQLKDIGRAFYVPFQVVTKEQYDIVAKYWGFNNIKSKEEFYKLLQIKKMHNKKQQ